jgi:ABC-type phosphate transport system substrate-binding protein
MFKRILFSILFISFTAVSVNADPIVVILNKDNPISSLKKSDVERFFLLKSQSWPSGEKVRPVNRDNKSKLKKAFVESVLNMSMSKYQDHWLSLKQTTGEREPKSLRSNKFVLKIVGKKKNAIGYLPGKYFENLEGVSKSRVKVGLKLP